MAHPLFPTDPGEEDDFECQWIAIAREERGSWVTAPEMFPADQLESLEQIQQRYGGGHYELFARAGGPSGRQHLTRRIRYRLAGPSLALDGTSAPPATPSAPIPMAGGIPGLDPTTALMFQFMQQSEARAERNAQMMMQMFSQSQNSQAQIIAAALSTKGGDGGAAMAQMATSMMQTVASMRTPTQRDSFKEGIEFAAKFAGDAPSEGGDESVIDSIAQIAAGVGAIQQMVPGGGASVPGATVVPHAPASAPASAPAPADPNRQPLPHVPERRAAAANGGRG